jgi:hypothetical protein
MDSIATDMIGGYNAFIKKQKELPAECFVSFYQFDDIYEAVFERKLLSEVPDLTHDTYVPRNSTALFDSMGKTIKNYGEYLASLKEEDRPERVLFVTITDGLNNASYMFDVAQIREMVKHQTEVYKWDFVFLGSNIDAWDAGASFGIAASNTLQFANKAGSVQAAFRSLGSTTGKYRMSAMKCAPEFVEADYAAQDQFLDGSQKSKNQQAAQASSKQAAPTTKPTTKK